MQLALSVYLVAGAEVGRLARATVALDARGTLLRQHTSEVVRSSLAGTGFANGSLAGTGFAGTGFAAWDALLDRLFADMGLAEKQDQTRYDNDEPNRLEQRGHAIITAPPFSTAEDSVWQTDIDTVKVTDGRGFVGLRSMLMRELEAHLAQWPMKQPNDVAVPVVLMALTDDALIKSYKKSGKKHWGHFKEVLKKNIGAEPDETSVSCVWPTVFPASSWACPRSASFGCSIYQNLVTKYGAPLPDGCRTAVAPQAENEEAGFGFGPHSDSHHSDSHASTIVHHLGGGRMF